MKKGKRSEKSVAVLTVASASTMTPDTLERIARWLRHQAFFLKFHNKSCAKRYRARYLVREDAA